MEDNGLSRKERERQQHREEILKAALTLFAEKGFSSVSVQEIAEKAEFAIGTLYNLFGSKEELFLELVKNDLVMARNAFRESLAGEASPEDKLRNFLEVKVRLVRDHAEFTRLYIHHLQGGVGVEGVRTVIMDVISDTNDRLAAVFDEGIEQGLFADRGARIMALGFNGLSSILIFHAIHFPDMFDFDSICQQTFALFFEKNLLMETA